MEQSNVENCANNKLDVVGGAHDFKIHSDRGADMVENEGHEHNDDQQIISLNQNNSYSCCSQHVEHSDNQIVSFEEKSYHRMQEPEALLDDKIEAEKETISHILEIKALLDNTKNVTETEIKVSLNMLTLIVRSVEHLKVTKIGTTVSGLLHHWSRMVVREATMVVNLFKRMIEERVDVNADLSERTKGPDPPTFLMNPPMDARVSIVNTPPYELATFFEDIDDEGNPISLTYETEELYESILTGEESTSISDIQKEKEELIQKLINPKNFGPSHKRCEIEMIHEGPLREELQPIPTKKRQKHGRKGSHKKWSNQIKFRPSDTEDSLRRFGQRREQIDLDNDIKTIKKKQKHEVDQRSNACHRHSPRSSDDAAIMDEKLETSHRKLHQAYQQHERECRRRSKRQRYSNQSSIYFYDS